MDQTRSDRMEIEVNISHCVCFESSWKSFVEFGKVQIWHGDFEGSFFFDKKIQITKNYDSP